VRDIMRHGVVAVLDALTFGLDYALGAVSAGAR
jgi:hypothetical protein